MEFTTQHRINDYKNFYVDINKMVTDTEDLSKYYSLKKIAQGAEGTVYLTRSEHLQHLILKKVDLIKILKDKSINKKVLNKNPLQIYELFYKIKRNLTMPSLIECIMYTLTNQLVFQGICPHFGLNYYWEYTSNKLLYYNEYINYSTLFDWGKKQHSSQEWINIIIQVLMGIISMQRYFKIIHGDLHSLNIFIQKVVSGGYWKYTIDKKEFLVPNLGWIVIISDFGFGSISNKVRIEWYYKDHLKNLSRHERHSYDINYLFNDLIKQKIPIYKMLQDTKSNLKNKKYKMINLLSDYYSYAYKIDNKHEQHKIIDTYNLNKPLNKNLIPENFRDLIKL